MNVKVEKLEGNKVKMGFTIDADKFIEGIDIVFKENQKHFFVPGFRKGKVPRAMVEKHYGIAVFFEDAFDKIVPEIYAQALKDNDIKPVSRPEINVIKMEKGEDLVFEAIVDVEPEITLGKYKGLEIEKPEYKVAKKDIDAKITEIAKQNARIVTVEDRALQQGDISTIDFEGFVGKEAFEGGKGEDFELEIGSGQFIPGFEDQLVDMKIGEEKDVKVTFPKEYHAEELKGKKATFKVTLKGIKARELPEIDDEFAKDVSEFETLKEFKKDIETKMKKENEQKAKQDLEQLVLDALISNTDIALPTSMIDNEIDAKLEEIKHGMKHQGMDFNTYLAMVGQKEDDVRASLEEQAIKDIKARLVLEAIVAKEDIKVTDEDLDNKIADLAAMYNTDLEDYKKKFNDNMKSYYKENLKYENAIKFVIENLKAAK